MHKTKHIWKFKLLILLFLSFYYSKHQAQSFDKTIKKSGRVKCEDVDQYAPEIINTYFDKNQIDDIYDFLEYWDSKCARKEKIIQIRTLIEIHRNTYDSNLISQHTIEELIAYRNNFTSKSNYAQQNAELLRFTQKLQKTLFLVTMMKNCC